MSIGQFQSGMEPIGTHLDIPRINVTAPLTHVSRLSSLEMPSPRDNSSSWGSLSVLPSPCSNGSSFLAFPMAPSPALSSPAFYCTFESEEGLDFPNNVGNGMAVTNLSDVLPTVVVPSESSEDATMLQGFPQWQRKNTLPADLMWPSPEGFINYPRPESNAIDWHNKIQVWSATTASRALSPQSSVVRHASQVDHTLDSRNVKPELYAGGQRDGATRPVGPIINPGALTFPGSLINPILREHSMSAAAFLAPASAFKSHRFFKGGAGPSSAIDDEIRVEEHANGMYILKTEVASTKMKEKSASRRKMEAKYMCLLPDCSDTFTKKHNLNSEHSNPRRMLRTHH